MYMCDEQLEIKSLETSRSNLKCKLNVKSNVKRSTFIPYHHYDGS